ncbi:MAG: hypothetical protein Q9182_000761 [Xanthomendoza sp. 2 TL-2023]
MRIRHPSVALLLLLIPCLQGTYAIRSLEQVADLAEGRSLPDTADTSPSVPSSLAKPNLDPSVGTKDAPVDGKDGRPHQGPFVETSAERDRKKAKESGDDEPPSAPKKPPKGEHLKEASYKDGRKIDLPETNDGVMDDPNRTGPKDGTRGTEGGISEKSRDSKVEGDIGLTKSEKKPDPPKEAPPLPHGEQEKLGQMESKDSNKKPSDTVPEKDDESKEKSKGLGGLEKPADLPEKPHDIPHPVPATSKKNYLEMLKENAPSLPLLTASAPDSLIQPLHSFLLSFTMIIFSEIGDKTFLIAALMAMKHPRLVVFTAAFAALILMTILSAILGHAVPTLIPKRYTNLLAAMLFLIFGAKMLREGYGIPRSQGVSEEMKEVEMELEEKEATARKMGRRRSSLSPYTLESGRISPRKMRSNTRLPAPPVSPPSSPDSRSPSPSRGSGFVNALSGINNLCSLLLSPAWVQTFVMTFLGEWGDRSQIATIAMAAGQDYWWVTGGAVSGHALCTAAAVIGGRAIAGRVSLRVVTLGGGFAFLAFGLVYLLEAMYASPLAPLESGQILLQNIYFSNDPAARRWISPNVDPARLFHPPVPVGSPMFATGICKVLKSCAEGWREGELVVAMCSWSEYTILEASGCQKIPSLEDLNGVGVTQFLGALGLTGLTAWYGINEVVKAKPEETVVVSGAAGATGSMVVQIAKHIIGCKHACVDYKSSSFEDDLKQETEGFVEVYFDNVGGEILDMMLLRIKRHGRIAACGDVAEYNKVGEERYGIKNWFEIVSNRIEIKGFIVLDYLATADEVMKDLLKARKEGKIKIDEGNETVVETGFEAVPETWLKLFQGDNKGKSITKVV